MGPAELRSGCMTRRRLSCKSGWPWREGKTPIAWSPFRCPVSQAYLIEGPNVPPPLLAQAHLIQGGNDDRPRSCSFLDSDYAVGWDAASRQSSSSLIQWPELPVQSGRQWGQNRDFGFMSYLAIHLWWIPCQIPMLQLPHNQRSSEKIRLQVLAYIQM